METNKTNDVNATESIGVTEMQNEKVNEVIECFIGVSYNDAKKVFEELNRNFIYSIPDYKEAVISAEESK